MEGTPSGFRRIRKGILVRVLCELFAEALAGDLGGAQGLVQIQIVLRGVNDAPGDVGAVVGGALEIGQEIRPDEACLDAAIALLHPENVARAHLLLEQIDDLLERLDLRGDGDIAGGECPQRKRENFTEGICKRLKFALGAVGEGKLLIAQFLGGSEDVDGVVGDALEVADRLEQLRRLLALIFAQLLCAEPDQIGAEDILIVVARAFILLNALCQSGGIFLHAQKRVFQRPDGAIRHFDRDGAAALQRQRGRGEQTLVQLGNGLGAALVGHHADRQLFKPAARREKHGCAENIEGGVRQRDAVHGRRLVENLRREDQLDKAEERQNDRDADHVEHQMHHRRAAGVFIGADRGKHGRDRRADVLTHDDGNGGGIADGSGHGQRLKNADGGGAGLDDRGQNRSGEHAEHRMLEGKEEIDELRHVFQPGDRAAHGVHAEHQRGKAEQDHAGVLFAAVLAEHVENDADEREHRRKGGRLEQTHPDAAAVDAAEAEQPCRDRGADVGTHDDVDGLPERHKPGVYKANDHDSRCGRALNDGRYAETRQKARHDLSGHFSKQLTELSACAALQRLPHEVHAEQKQAKAADHCQKIKNIHTNFPHFP